MSKYFVILRHYNRDVYMPMVLDDEDILALFDSREEAEDLLADHDYAQAVGYEIFEI